jgi:hypothetical protein
LQYIKVIARDHIYIIISRWNRIVLLGSSYIRSPQFASLFPYKTTRIKIMTPSATATTSPEIEKQKKTVTIKTSDPNSTRSHNRKSHDKEKSGARRPEQRSRAQDRYLRSTGTQDRFLRGTGGGAAEEGRRQAVCAVLVMDMNDARIHPEGGVDTNKIMVVSDYIKLASSSTSIPDQCHDWGRRSEENFPQHMTHLGSTLCEVFDAFSSIKAGGLHPNKPLGFAQRNAILDDMRTRDALEELRAFTDISEELFTEQVLEYLQVVHTRARIIGELIKKHDQTWKIVVVSKKKIALWGSRRQYAAGRVTTAILHQQKITKMDKPLHPFFGMLLVPTQVGGRGGGGGGPAQALPLVLGDLHDARVVQAIVHDAFLYAHTYHNVGPGVKYTGGWYPFYLLRQFFAEHKVRFDEK